MEPLPEGVQEFIKAVDKAYTENDEDRLMRERAFDLSSQELIQVNDELRKSEEKYRLIAENTADLIAVTDMNLRFTYISPSIMRTHGFTVEEAMKMTIDQFLPPESLKYLLRLFEEEMKLEASGTADPGRIRILELEEYKKDGSIICMESSVSAQRDKENKIIGLLTVNRDITDRKITEAALSESEIKYRRIFESFEDIYYQTDATGIMRVLSPSAYRIAGWSPDELIGKPTSDMYARPEDREKLLADLSRNGFLRDYEVLMKKKDGTQTYASLSASILTDPDGRPCGIAGTLRDITERKQAEEERQQGFEKLRKALRATVQSISLTLEMKDPYTSGHQQRVADLAHSIATEMGLSADRQDFIRTASAIHDIGKISIPSSILSKPTKLTDLEFRLIKTHSQSGYDILKDIEFPWPVADVVLQHHERMDGSGYPQGLKGNDISLEARIVAVADVVEAIAFHRPYRPSLGIVFALEEISRKKDILYDADAVDACLKLFQEKNYTMDLKK